ncbi:RDD family protein [Streptomyces calvus]|uniref:RDD family protein n=1 Tax=Streptomyces calvus TaxID=67282 RepID=UPI003718F25F
MSAPTPAPGDDSPREGYYPDPSIPGYVRYWNGSSWVPGTSRPAPKDGEPLAPPPGVRPAQPSVEETGPHFFDEDPQDEPSPATAPPANPAATPASSPASAPAPSPASSASPPAVSAPAASAAPAEAQHGSRPEPASAWGADRSRQSGFGGEQDRKVSWGADPRVPHASPPEAASQGAQDADAGNTVMFRRPTATPRPAADPATAAPADEGTMTFRAVKRDAPQGAGPQGPQQGPVGQQAPASSGPGFGAGKAAADRAAAAATAPSGPQQVTAPPVPPQAAAPAAPPAPAAPLTSGPGGGQASWAQQVHRLADGGEPPVAPWKPPVEDPFQAAARRQAAARPAALGRRLAARLLDTLVVAAVTAVAGVPLGIQAVDHIQAKIDAAKLSGETVTVWLLDGTTAVHLGITLAVLLLAGVLYEVLPTVKWGRTLGKKLLGLEVRDIEGHEAPEFGAALRRWLVYCIPGLLVVGVVGVLWCLFDKPWRQCWHDKAAHTFVAG